MDSVTAKNESITSECSSTQISDVVLKENKAAVHGQQTATVSFDPQHGSPSHVNGTFSDSGN